jgi:hypothetical protein
MRLTLLIGTLVVVAGLLEIGTRLFSDVVPPLVVKDPVIGKRYVRSFEDVIFVAEADRRIRLRFNNVGFRGPDHPFEKPAGVRRVALMGDSMIASLSVDEEDTLVSLLGSRLNEAASDAKWEVLNFGVSGSSPAQQIVLYRELVSHYEPDVVLSAFFVGNDLADNCNRLSHNPRIYFDFDEDGNFRQLSFSAGRSLASQFLDRYSRFYVWQKRATARMRTKVRRAVRRVNPGQLIYCRNEPEDVAHAWRISQAAARTLRREVEGRGARFAVVMLPSPEQVYDDYFQKVAEVEADLTDSFDRDYPDRRMGELCRAAGVPFLSMTADFRAAAPSATTDAKEEWLFHKAVGHFNERGNQIAANAVFRFLTEANAQTNARPLVGRAN